MSSLSKLRDIFQVCAHYIYNNEQISISVIPRLLSVARNVGDLDANSYQS